MSSNSPRKLLICIRLVLLYILPPTLFFSYYPIISLGASASMNFELSLPIIWLVFYDFVSLAAFIPLLKSHGLRRSLRGISDRKFFAFSLFPLYLTASTLWSPNPTRALLTAGLAWALFIAIFATYELLVLEYRKNYRLFWQKFKKILYISTVLICIFCWLQCVLDLAGLPREATLLCPGCSYTMFGFPHPSGFAIEPQFMGNLLLFPTLLILLDINTKNPRKTLPLAFLFTATLFLTFSRGAIYSFAVALAFIIIVTIIRTKSVKKLLVPIVLVLISFCFTLTAQGVMAALSPTNDTFSTGIAKSIHQLSLGRLDFRTPGVTDTSTSSTPVSTPQPVENSPKSVEKPVDNSVEKYVENSIASDPDTPNAFPADSAFSGYVPESTDIRLKLNDYAISLWQSSPGNFLFGVGLGGAGTALAVAYPTEYSAKEIIQNQYFSLALETGLIGLILLAFSLSLILWRLHRTRSPLAAKLLFYSLALAYAVSLGFFSGMANATHIYLFLALTLINIIA